KSFCFVLPNKIKLAMIAVIANIILSVILMQYLYHGGLALATSLASMLNLGLLLRVLKQRIGGLGLKRMTGSIFKSTACSALMGLAVWISAIFLIPAERAGVSSLFFGLAVCIITGIILYSVLSYFSKSPEFEEVLGLVKESIRKK
ncbi:polysaccharide biosynthesis C-terminal domain-containing protein, partial [Thermodesulfobacteriota bacterium]